MQRSCSYYKLWYACAGVNWCTKNSTSSCNTESSSKRSLSWFEAEKRVGEYECLQACSQESRTKAKCPECA